MLLPKWKWDDWDNQRQCYDRAVLTDLDRRLSASQHPHRQLLTVGSQPSLFLLVLCNLKSWQSQPETFIADYLRQCRESHSGLSAYRAEKQFAGCENDKQWLSALAKSDHVQPFYCRKIGRWCPDTLE